nr:MAG TPA: hypothetical protein [Caudoviricetes sp.]
MTCDRPRLSREHYRAPVRSSGPHALVSVGNSHSH